MKLLLKQNIWRVKPYVPGKPIEEVKREYGLSSVIKLASNENPFPPSPQVLAALRTHAKEINRYPDGDCFYLRQALARRLRVLPQQLIFGNGSDEILVLALRALVSDGDEVMVAKPSFLVYGIASQVMGAALKEVLLKNMRYDLPAMAQAVTDKTKIIFIGNPDNPAGTYVTAQEVEEFLKAVPSHALVVFDEAYYEFVQKNDYPDAIGLMRTYENVLVTRTFSKFYGLAGLRVGFGIGHPKLIDGLNRIREPFNINSLAQAAALACLLDIAYYRRMARKIASQKIFLLTALRKMGLDCKESATNFILIDVKKNSSEVCEQLLHKGVIIRDMNFWGLENFVRVTVGTNQENRRFLAALKGIL